MTALGELLTDAQSGFACGKQDEAGVFQFRMNNVTTDGRLDLGSRRRVPDDAHSRMERFLLSPRDVLFNATNSPENVGKSVLVGELDEPAVFSNHFLRLRPDADRLDAGYLAHWLHWNFQRGLFHTMCRQWVNQATVDRQRLLGLSLNPPPLEEQRRIAAILDRADRLRTKRTRQASKSGSLPQSIFASIIGSPETIMSAWPCKRLGELLDFITSGSRGWARYYVDDGDLFLRIQNVRNDELVLDDIAMVDAPDTAEARRTRVEAGDVLLSITADLGRTAVVPDNLGSTFINQHLSILRTSLVPDYLSAFLSSPAGQAQILRRNRQGVKAGLNFDDIRSFEIPVPPHEVQQSFQVARRKAQDVSRSVRKGQSEVDALCRATSRRLFATGAG